MEPYSASNISKNEISASYDNLYKTQDKLRDSDSFYQWVLRKLVVQTQNKCLLDIACGIGYLIKYSREMGIQSTGIDISREALLRAARNTGSRAFIQADGEFLPFADNSYDYVTILGSLEHFPNPIKGVQEIRRTLAPGGRAAFLLPNNYYLADIIWHVWRTGYSVSHSQVLERFATYNEWKDLLESGGLTVIKGYKYNRILPKSIDDWKYYLHRPQRLLYLAVAPLIPFNLSYHFLYICASN